MGPCTSRVPLPLPLLLTTCSVLCLGGAAGGEKNCRASTGVCSGKGGVLLQLTANKSPAIGSQSSWSFTAAEGRAAAAALQMASALFKQASHVAVEERAHLRNSTEDEVSLLKVRHRFSWAEGLRWAENKDLLVPIVLCTTVLVLSLTVVYCFLRRSRQMAAEEVSGFARTLVPAGSTPGPRLGEHSRPLCQC
mmetsp:Transcript_42333/g.98026  ORF Transcript_42333/g.98026 Transcript_42333/m.98026 type:complete len:193 (-) Transcript_42333:118-696(-)